MDETQCNRAQAVRQAMGSLGLPLETAMQKYAAEKFMDGQSKFEVFQAVMECSLTDELVAYFEKRCGGKDLRFLRQRRSAAEYAINLILGWLLEDAVLDRLRREGVLGEHAGTDREREFLVGSKVKANADLRTSSGRLIEVAYDATDYFWKSNRYDLRDDKFQRLVGEDALIFGLSIQRELGFVLEAAKIPETEVSQGILWLYGGRPGYTIAPIRDRLLMIDEAFALLRELS